ncbi:MAG: L-threonine 3-dehydrogenase [Arcanobacterium sp.]|nr:L-threonine 3-dehydrogenase [Arcanobacterium sp.]
MKALVKSRPEVGLELLDIPEPVTGPNDVKVRVLRTGICGTDVHIQRWDAWAQKAVATPRIIGHEFVGEIVELGELVTGLEIGQIVSGEGHYVCGRCRACLAGRRELCANTLGIGYSVDGAMCEYFVFPAANVWVHPQDLDLDVAAIFDPFGNAVHTALQFPCLAEDVLVSGAGPIGIMAALVAQFQGARHVVLSDISDERLALAESLGIKTTVNVAKRELIDIYPELNMKEGFDVGLEMSGAAQAIRSMIDHMVHGGRIAMLGTPIADVSLDLQKIIFNMLTLQGVTGRRIFETWYAASALVSSGLDISGVITDRLPYTEYERAFAIAGDGKSGKVVLNWVD